MDEVTERRARENQTGVNRDVAEGSYPMLGLIIGMVIAIVKHPFLAEEGRLRGQ
jgi:hypothetical protein